MILDFWEQPNKAANGIIGVRHLSLSLSLSHTYSPSLRHNHTLSLSHTCTHPHTHTHTHTHSLSTSLCPSLLSLSPSLPITSCYKAIYLYRRFWPEWNERPQIIKSILIQIFIIAFHFWRSSSGEFAWYCFTAEQDWCPMTWKDKGDMQSEL